MADPSEGNLVQLSGPVTLYESNEIRELLQAAIGEGGPLTLDLETTGPWDLAGLQLLIATVSSATKKGIEVTFAEVPKSCAEIAERAGLADWLAARTGNHPGFMSTDSS